MDSIPYSAEEHLRAELARLLAALGDYLVQQRVRGRTAAADAVGGNVIEDGEAEGLLAQLSVQLQYASPDPVYGNALTVKQTRSVPGAAAQNSWLPLYHAIQAFNLSQLEYDALLLALAVELDSRFGRLIAYLNDHAGKTRPTLGLALAIQTDGERMPLHPPAAVFERPLIRDGLLEVEGEGPGPGLALRLQPEIVRRLTGISALAEGKNVARLHMPDPGLLDQLVLDKRVRDKVQAWGEAIRRDRTGPPLILHGLAGSGRTTMARAAISEARRCLV
ncbi:MAG: hypothetical protein JO356_16065, partial [Acidobacteria bacterium]|nr:hypothetical protein [Acidobacteriota bacterium]